MAYELQPPKRLGPYRFGLLETLGSKPLPMHVYPEEGATFVQTTCEFPKDYNTAACLQDTKPDPERMIRGIQDPPLTPGGIYVALECSSVANSQAQVNREAQRVLERGRPLFLSNRFLDVVEANPNLDPQPGPVTPSCALSLVQDYIADGFGLGRASLIFAPPAVVSVWTEGHAVREEDGRFVTSLGNTVIVAPTLERFGAHYVYGTDSVPDIYLSEVQVLSDEGWVALKRENSFIGIVEQQYMFAFDPCVLPRYEVEVC